MTRLAADFETDLPPDFALAVCRDALAGLGWRIETAQGERVIAHTTADARIAVQLRDSGGVTDLRIAGSDSGAGSSSTEGLAAELDRARDAIAERFRSVDPPELRDGSASPRPSLLNPTPFYERPQSAQVVAAGVIPAVFGAISGVVLGASAGAYWVLQLLALAGAVLAGFEHRDGREGARRGLVAGAVYGIFLLLAHAVAGTHATVKLPGFAPFLIVITAGVGALATGLSARWRNRGGQAREDPRRVSSRR